MSSTMVSISRPISQSKIGVEVCDKLTTSAAQRPMSLLLDQGPTMKGEGGGEPAAAGGLGGGGVGGGVQRKKKRTGRASEARVKKFLDLYQTTGESLGEGSFGHVTTYRNIATNKEFAVKMIEKSPSKSRHRVLKEIEIFHHCQGHDNILQMVEYFEEDDKFFLVFEKMEGGTLLDCILRRKYLTEQEASLVIRDIASGLNFLHKKGIAHRDLKPENILCVKAGQLTPVKICDFDLGSGVQVDSHHCSPISTPELLSPVGSADFMAPEVVDVWQYQAWSYDKRCDLWSLGTILYILLCGYRPFSANCGNDCGFDEGRACEDCQELLFSCIQQGVYSLDGPDWAQISDEAKDLIQHLLVKNPYQRYTAEQVLAHPWISKEASRAPLATPFILSRNNSVRELGMYAETANAVNRLILRHLSINEVCSSGGITPLSFPPASEFDNPRCCTETWPPAPKSSSDEPPSYNNDEGYSPEGSAGGKVRGMFQLAGFDEEEEEDAGIGHWSEEDEAEHPGMGRWSEEEVEEEGGRGGWTNLSPPLAADGSEYAWTSLSTPGGSGLARRRVFKVQHASESSVDSGNVCAGTTPPTGGAASSLPPAGMPGSSTFSGVGVMEKRGGVVASGASGSKSV